MAYYLAGYDNCLQWWTSKTEEGRPQIQWWAVKIICLNCHKSKRTEDCLCASVFWKSTSCSVLKNHNMYIIILTTTFAAVAIL